MSVLCLPISSQHLPSSGSVVLSVGCWTRRELLKPLLSLLGFVFEPLDPQTGPNIKAEEELKQGHKG